VVLGGGGVVVVGAGLAVVGLGLAVVVGERRPGDVVVVVVAPRRVVPGDDDVEAPGTTVPGPLVAGKEEVVVSESAARRMGRPLLTPWGRPAMATPIPMQTTRRTAVHTRFAVAPLSSMAASLTRAKFFSAPPNIRPTEAVKKGPETNRPVAPFAIRT
jgi:hypothetical protein